MSEGIKTGSDWYGSGFTRSIKLVFREGKDHKIRAYTSSEKFYEDGRSQLFVKRITGRAELKQLISELRKSVVLQEELRIPIAEFWGMIEK